MASHAALLRASGNHAGEAFDLEGIVDAAIDSGVPHGALLGEFVEAALGDDEARLGRARDAIAAKLGPAALVDVAGAVASFNAVVKVADGSGIVVEEFKVELIRQMPERLGQRLGGLRQP
jgi:hypothetical protein